MQQPDLLHGDMDHHAAIGSDDALLGFLKWERELEQAEERRAAAKAEKRNMLEAVQFGESSALTQCISSAGRQETADTHEHSTRSAALRDVAIARVARRIMR